MNDHKFNKAPIIASLAIMALSVFSWPYGFYVLLKFIVTGTAAYCAWYWHNTKKEYNIVFWLAVAVGRPLPNPPSLRFTSTANKFGL